MVLKEVSWVFYYYFAETRLKSREFIGFYVRLYPYYLVFEVLEKNCSDHRLLFLVGMVLKRKYDGSMLRIFVGILSNGFNDFSEGDGAGHRKTMFDYRLLIAILHVETITCTSISRQRYPF